VPAVTWRAENGLLPKWTLTIEEVLLDGPVLLVTSAMREVTSDHDERGAPVRRGRPLCVGMMTSQDLMSSWQFSACFRMRTAEPHPLLATPDGGS
jgi:hypothetical protein